MKRIILSILGASVMLCTVNGQVNFGIKGGLNLANWRVANPGPGNTMSFYPSFHAGILVSGYLSDNIIIQSEAQYSMQGSKDNYVDNGNSTDVIAHFDYINIPLLMKFQTKSGVFAEVGPQVGFLLDARTSLDGSPIDVKNEVNTTDISLVMGLGYLSSGNIGIDARFNLGLSNISKSSSDKAYNQVIEVGLFLQFGGRRN
jgi:hypothetical protein